MRGRSRMQRRLNRAALVAQAEIDNFTLTPPQQSAIIRDVREANDADVPWYQALFYTYRRNSEEDDCDF